MPEVDSKLEVVERVLSSELDLKAFRQHLDDVISGEAFRGSRRSAQFLLHIVEKTIHNETDALKERTIGTELFGRKADYDTGDDAIVRVTASEVRRRLLRHYGQSEDHSMYRINLLPGGYIPEIIRLKETNGNGSHGSETKWEFPPASIPSESADAAAPLQTEIGVATAGPVQKTVSRPWASRIILTLSMLFALLIGFFLYPVFIHRAVPFPWQPFISVSNPLQIITSDPNIAEIRGLTNHPISVSDYANRRFGCETLSNDLRYVCETLLQGDKAAAVDAQAVAKIAALVERYKGKFNVHVARSIRMSDLRTDDSYIFLGSSRSNPWVDLFGDQMDFRIVYDPVTAQDVVVNRNPRQGELPAYKPTAKGFGTGQSYAVIEFLRNPDQQGKVLSLAGASAEGTLAAVNLVVNDDFPASLRSACDIKTLPAYFEELVRVDTMAGASTETQVIACHVHPPAK
jgi:hypothetical protein